MHDQVVDAAAGVVEPKRRKVRKTRARAAEQQRGRARGGTLRQSRQSHLGSQGG